MSDTEASLLKRGANNLRVTLGVIGLFTAVLGLLILLYPVKSGAIVMQVVAAIAAAYAIIAGIAYLGNSLFSKTLRPWARVGNILLGLLYLLGGIVLLTNLTAAAEVLAIFIVVTIGVLWIFEGIIVLTTLGESRSKGWSVFYGLISIVSGVLLIVLPLVGIVALWWLAGVTMLVLGIVQIVRAFSIKPQKFAVGE